jgi:hypothetical protein
MSDDEYRPETEYDEAPMSSQPEKFDVAKARALADELEGRGKYYIDNPEAKYDFRAAAMLRAACVALEERDKRILGEVKLADDAISECRKQVAEKETLARENERLLRLLSRAVSMIRSGEQLHEDDCAGCAELRGALKETHAVIK